MRPGSQRVQVAGVGPSLQQPITVNADAPVAREGMRSATRGTMGTSAGPGRQVGDRSYYIGLIRPKIAELTTEMERLAEQEQLIIKNSGVLVQLQQKSNELNEEIAKLKGELADVNLTVENVNQRDVRVIREEYVALESVNADQRRDVDKLFVEVRSSEAKTKNDTKELEDGMQQLEKKLLREHQDFSQFKSIRDEAFSISDKVLERQHEVRMLCAMRDMLIGSLSKNPDKKRACELLLTILKKRQEKDELTKKCALSVEEEKQQVIQQIKSTRLDIEVLERQVNDTRDTLQERKVLLSSLETDLKGFSGDNFRAYQELLAKDREMQAFIDEYPDLEREKSEKVAATQASISKLLERISQALELQREMSAERSPPAMHVLNTEMDLRRDQLKIEQETHQRVQKELMERKGELEKVTDLDRKIKEELASHAQIMEQRREEIEKYSDIAGLKESISLTRKELEAQKTYLNRVRDYGRKLVSRVAVKVENSMTELQKDETYMSLLSPEQKLRILWQPAFSMEEFVRLKEKETQYLACKGDCLAMVDEINTRLKDPSNLAVRVGPQLTNVAE